MREKAIYCEGGECKGEGPQCLPGEDWSKPPEVEHADYRSVTSLHAFALFHGDGNVLRH